MSELKEFCLKSETVFQGKILEVKLDQVKLKNGRTSSREVVLHPGAVGIIPFVSETEIVLVRQYRYPVQEELLEIPAGKLDPGESAESCAIRELEEETGYKAEKLNYLGSIYTSPGFSSEIIHIYWAEQLDFTRANPDPDEILETVTINFEKAVKMCLDNKIKDAKTVVALIKMWLERGR